MYIYILKKNKKTRELQADQLLSFIIQTFRPFRLLQCKNSKHIFVITVMTRFTMHHGTVLGDINKKPVPQNSPINALSTSLIDVLR